MSETEGPEQKPAPDVSETPPDVVMDTESETQSKSPENGQANQQDQQQYCTENVHYENDVAIYTDPNTQTQYQWDKDKNEWVLRIGADKKGEYGFENDTHTYKDADGTKYTWDKTKNEWLPVVDDDFIAKYQMSYGFVDNTSAPEPKPSETVSESVDTVKGANKSEVNASADTKTGTKAKKKPAPVAPNWFDADESHNTNVYISNLPVDINEEEFVEVMQKCGLIMKDYRTGKLKIKLYKDPNNSDQLKGDGLCTYIKRESVELALSVLDGYDVRGKQIKVERAKFQMKGNAYDPALKPRKLKKRDKERIKKRQEKLFAWQPDKLRGVRGKHERVVIIKNLFDPDTFAHDPRKILEYQTELRDECMKCGVVRRVVIHDCHEDGVAQVTMSTPEEADQLIQVLHGRFYSQRRLIAQTWDGRTKYKKDETEEEIQKRIEKWDEFLDKGGDELKMN